MKKYSRSFSSFEFDRVDELTLGVNRDVPYDNARFVIISLPIRISRVALEREQV